MSRIFAHKKALIGAALAVICLLIATFVVLPRYVSCQLDKYASEAEITRISLREIGFTKLMVDVTVRVENPNPIGATVDRIAYDLYFQLNDEWVFLGRADRTEDVAVGSHEFVSVEVTNEVGTLSAIAMVLQAISHEGVVTVKATGSVWIRVGPIALEVPFEHIRELGA